MADAANVNYTPRPQDASLLCWAAATQIVIDTLNQPQDQPTLAAYAWLPATGSPAIVAAFKAKVALCHTDIAQYCNRAYLPVLDDLGFTCLHSAALNPPYMTEDLISADIDAGRPIIFGWLYDNDTANGLHFMVIVGYRRTATRQFKLNIFDPLPVGLGNAQTISFSNYTVATPLDLHNDMGLPYLLSDSYYNIQPPLSVPAPPTGLTVDGPPGPAPAAIPARAAAGTRFVELAEAIATSRPAALTEAARQEAEQGRSLSAAFPFPIVALSLAQLRSTDPTAAPGLLRRETGTVLYPLESDGHVRDSFLMIRRADQWVAGGYANTTVTRLLVAQRHQRAHSPAQRAEHYLLSVPALGAFFLAHGSGASASLIPMTADASIKVGGRHLQADTPYRADQLLPALIETAQRFQPFRHRDERSLR